VLFDFSNKEDLLNRAKEQSKKAPINYKTTVELYYITRYFVAVFEARNHTIPIQIWNEYRNALDHFFRHITNDGHPEVSDNLSLMEGHMKRAALDIMKLTCHESDKWLNAELSKYHNDAMLLIDNGVFLHSFQKRKTDVSCMFQKAKTEDYKFGTDSKKNKQILSLYIDSAIAYESLREEIIKRTPDIQKSQSHYQKISRKAFLPNVWAGIISGIIVATFLHYLT
jgi:hypothetical protein